MISRSGDDNVRVVAVVMGEKVHREVGRGQ